MVRDVEEERWDGDLNSEEEKVGWSFEFCYVTYSIWKVYGKYMVM